MSDLSAIEREITAGLAAMRVEAGIEKPYRLPRASLFCFLFAFAIIGAVVLGSGN